MLSLDVIGLNKLRTVLKTNTLHEYLFLSNVVYSSFGSKRSRLTEIKVCENGTGNSHGPVHTSTTELTW